LKDDVEEKDVEWFQHVEAADKGRRDAFRFAETGACEVKCRELKKWVLNVVEWKNHCKWLEH